MSEQETREALAAFIDGVLDGDAGTNVGPGLAEAILARFAVTSKDETEWEYGVRHVGVDGWPTTRPHLSLANAVEDFASCGLHCSVVRRRRPGEWEPVYERTDRA